MTLEHLPNPLETINILKTKLKKGGFFINVLPALGYTLKYRTSEENPLNTSADGHLFGWTFYEFNYMMNYCGFTNILNKKIYRRGIDRFAKLNRWNLYFPVINILGLIIDDFDIIIVSRKD